MTSPAAAPTVTTVPFVDLHPQHREIADEVAAGFDRVIANTAFVGGQAVSRFEQAYAAYIGVQHCVGVANGTDALELALRATGVQPGDEVVLPANTFVATAAAVMRAQARPVLTDVDQNHLLMDPASAAGMIGPRTRAVVPVHLYGQAAPMDEVTEIARQVGCQVIEDAAQAQGARQRGRAAGSFGLAAATSFYPGKNLGAYGDAGAVLTDDEGVARRLRLLRNHGGEAQYEHEIVGMNSRLDALQAVVLTAKLQRLDAWNEQRRAAALLYDRLLHGIPSVWLPATAAGNEHVWHLYVIRVPQRDRVRQRLTQAGVQAGIHYPLPIHLLAAFRSLGYARGDFPVAERAADEILSLPMFPGITVEQQERVAEALEEAMQETS
jgi:dTDP-4-amino-4,6-dideoxygalactose transaminase